MGQGSISPNRLWRLVVVTVISGGLLWLAASGVSWSEIGVALGSSHWNLVIVAVVCLFIATVLRAWCWRSLLVDQTVSIPLFQVWQIVLVGQFLNICVPARGGDLARVYLISKTARMSRTGAVASLVLEKFFDAITFLLVFGSVALFVDLPPRFEGLGRGIAGVVVCLSLGILVLAWRGPELSRLIARKSHGYDTWAARLARHVQTTIDSMRVIQYWHRLVWMQAGYLGIWLALAMVNLAILRALEIEVSIAAAFVVLIVLQVGTSVPSTPGKVGVFQYLVVLALTPFGVPVELALTYGVLLHVVGFGPVVVLGGLWSWAGLAATRRVH